MKNVEDAEIDSSATIMPPPPTATTTTPATPMTRRARGRLARAYAPGHDAPLAGYLALVGGFALAFGGALLCLARARKLRAPSAPDLPLLGVATHKATRILTKDWVTAPLRAPFVEYVESAGGGEVKERARGTGMQKAIGALVTCPWCSGPWVAGALVTAHALAPKATRVVASMLTVVALSDWLHEGYEWLRKQRAA